MKTKKIKTWHVELRDGSILNFKTKVAAQRVAHAIHGDEQLVWCSVVEWAE